MGCHCRKLLNFLFFLILSACLVNPVFAQLELVQEEYMESFVVRDMGVIEDGYYPTTLENLSKLYWAIGALDLESNDDIDNYIKINDCDIYRRFSDNDFEWKEIREMTRKSILMNMARFPRKYEVVKILFLGDYDIDTETFEVAEISEVDSLMRIAAITNRKKNVCGTKSEIYNYPRNILVELNQPISIQSIPVIPELAELYIQEAKENLLSKSHSLYRRRRLGDYKRIAFLRLKVNVLQFKDRVPKTSSKGALMAVFSRYEGYDVFADPEFTKPLYTEDILKKAKRTRTKEDIKKELDALNKMDKSSEE